MASELDKYQSREARALWKNLLRVVARSSFNGTKAPRQDRELFASFMAIGLKPHVLQPRTLDNRYVPFVDIEAFDILGMRKLDRERRNDPAAQESLRASGRTETLELNERVKGIIAGFYAHRAPVDHVELSVRMSENVLDSYGGIVRIIPVLKGTIPESEANAHVPYAQQEWDAFADYVQNELAVSRIKAVASKEEEPPYSSPLGQAVHMGEHQGLLGALGIA